MQPKAIIFDAVGTLIRPAESIASTYVRLAKAEGSALTEDDIRARFPVAIATHFDVASHEPTSDERQRQAWARVVGEVINDVTDQAAARLFQELWTWFSRPEAWSLYPEVEDVLNHQALSSRVLALGTNFDSRIVEVVRGKPGLSRIEFIACSGVLGYSKPDPRFFTAIQLMLGREPAELMMVGDDPEKDCVAARKCGWSAIEIARPGASLGRVIEALN